MGASHRGAETPPVCVDVRRRSAPAWSASSTVDPGHGWWCRWCVGGALALASLLAPGLTRAQPASGRAGRRTGCTIEDRLRSATVAPIPAVGILAPLVDSCNDLNEFERRRCLVQRPRERAAALRTRWRTRITGSGLVEVGRYDFRRRVFPITFFSPIMGPLRQRRDGTRGWLSASRRPPGRSATVITRGTVQVRNQAEAERWANTYRGRGRLGMEVVFRIGGTWATTEMRPTDPMTLAIRMSSGRGIPRVRRTVHSMNIELVRAFDASGGNVIFERVIGHTPCR